MRTQEGTVKEMLRPGDVLVLGSHEPDGKALNRAWLASVKGQVNILYGRMFSIYADYGPTRVNYVVSDADNYGRDDFGRVAVGPLSSRPGMSPDDKILRSRLIRLASAKPELRATILPLLKTAKVKGFDGLQKDSDKFAVDLKEFHSQLETDIEEAPQAFKVLYRPLLAKLETVQKVMKELSAAAKKVQDGLDKSREAK